MLNTFHTSTHARALNFAPPLDCHGSVDRSVRCRALAPSKDGTMMRNPRGSSSRAGAALSSAPANHTPCTPFTPTSTGRMSSCTPHTRVNAVTEQARTIPHGGGPGPWVLSRVGLRAQKYTELHGLVLV